MIFLVHVHALSKKVDYLEKQLCETTKLANHNEQYSRRWLVRVYGIKEDEKEDCTSKFVQLVNDKLKIVPPLKAEDIEASHRIGAVRLNDSNTPNKARPIIVRFTNRSRRYKVIEKRHLLKKSGFTIADDITKKNIELMNRLKNNPSFEEVWFSNGTVKAKHSLTGKKRIVDLYDDVSKLF